LLGIVVATLPLLPMAKQNCQESGMTFFIERKRGIKKNKIHDDKQRDKPKCLFCNFVKNYSSGNHLYMKNVIEDQLFKTLVMIIKENYY
jgi:hypothetical protein